jgi:sulfur relay (sulfurtransferase) DsrC/TusE family protein
VGLNECDFSTAKTRQFVASCINPSLAAQTLGELTNAIKGHMSQFRPVLEDGQIKKLFAASDAVEIIASQLVAVYRRRTFFNDFRTDEDVRALRAFVKQFGEEFVSTRDLARTVSSNKCSTFANSAGAPDEKAGRNVKLTSR